MIEIADGVFIDESRIVLKASRSSGPGGQNVNKVSTRVTLLFDLADCEGLSDLQRQMVLSRLAARIDKGGMIRVICQRFRTQSANRRAAIEKLAELLSGALKTRPARRRTEVPHAARQRRLELKRRRGVLKRQRAGKSRAGDFAD